MLRTTIQTTDESGKELPVPPDLLAKVRRAADILSEMLRKVTDKFDIKARWWFEPRTGKDFAVHLGLTSEEGGEATSEFPNADLSADDSIRRGLWTATSPFLSILSEELDRRIKDIFRGLYATLEEWRNEDAGENAQPTDRGTLQTNP